ARLDAEVLATVIPTRLLPTRLVPTRLLPTRLLPTRLVPTRLLPTRLGPELLAAAYLGEPFAQALLGPGLLGWRRRRSGLCGARAAIDVAGAAVHGAPVAVGMWVDDRLPRGDLD